MAGRRNKSCESLINKTEPVINVEHALHVLEVIEAARKSSATGMKVAMKSGFAPLICDPITLSTFKNLDIHTNMLLQLCHPFAGRRG